MPTTLLKNAKIVNEGKVTEGDVLIKNGRIEKVADSMATNERTREIDLKGKFLFPGVIDDQVHFREPGLTHKANIYTEAKAAVAGGVTSFMEMPNTVPNALTQELLEDKYQIARQTSLANYSFYMGASNENLEEVLRTDKQKICGVKIFMGSSTGNMLVDNETVLNRLFSNVDHLIATHCEDEATIRANTQIFKEKYGEDMPIKYHPAIRNEEACYKSASMAVGLAKKHGTRLHILHISTAKECGLFEVVPLEKKKITAEACVHHMWFDDSDYEGKGTLIKWNPAVKTENDRKSILQAVLDGRIDVIATDHAPHTTEEKSNGYFSAPSGGPLIQHSLVAMLDFYHEGKVSLEQIAEKMCHNPAILFRVEARGYIREGYHADLVVADLDAEWKVSKENVIAKCGWSPFEGHTFKSKVTHTFVNGNLVYENGSFDESTRGDRLLFNNK